MKAKLFVLLAIFLGSPISAGFGLSRLFRATRMRRSTEHMAIAIWVLMGAVMSVLGGVGAFSFHLWRHAAHSARAARATRSKKISKSMSSLALINRVPRPAGECFRARLPDRSHHRVLPLVHGRALRWVVGLFYFCSLFVFTRVGIRAADHEGVKSGISTHLEFAVVLIEAVLLVGFAVPLWAKRVNEFPRDKDAILVHAIGQQFNWNFHLPGPDGVFGRREINLVTNRIRSDSIRTIRRRRMTLSFWENCTFR